jgi:hypothetical protein
MRELNKDEIKELGEIWMLIKSGRADNIDDKSKAIKFWNNIAGTNFKLNSSCQSCLGTVFYGLEGLYKEYFKNDI